MTDALQFLMHLDHWHTRHGGTALGAGHRGAQRVLAGHGPAENGARLRADGGTAVAAVRIEALVGARVTAY
jgi:hypothetical protein